MKIKYLLILLSLLILVFSCQPEWIKHAPKYDYSGMSKRQVEIHKKVEAFLYYAYTDKKPLKLERVVRIDSVRVDERSGVITVDFNKYLSYLPLREANVLQMYRAVKERLGKKYKHQPLILRTLGIPIQDLIPNYFRSSVKDYDARRVPVKTERPVPLVRRVKIWKASKGLYGKNIALWNSHGWYYKKDRDRWEWQRPRLFQTVEDLLPTSFVLPYLMPMLENAGAMVFNPRERDIQQNMVVVDNDKPSRLKSAYQEKSGTWKTAATNGFAEGIPPYSNENPFSLGTSRETISASKTSAEARWTPDIPQRGDYAVYVSYAASDSNVTDARYSVYHLGGRSDFLVNQRLAGKTWVYLGTFLFNKGASLDSGSVRLTNLSADSGLVVSADAVRFGGGTGNIFRGGRTSGRPRFEEGARYNLQYSGIPDSIVWNLNGGENDYKDDYQSRGEYVNYLKGAPFGPTLEREARGLGIPIDLSLAFHTDAGISRTDTVIGTLSIYSLLGADTLAVFPDSVSRLACRDLADVVQTQIVQDIQAQFDSAWNRRSLRNAQYSENSRPNVPSMILELLSHQNFKDMQFALDPAFRFTTARAIYKGMLRFVSAENQRDYVVQPLPVTHFSAQFDTLGNTVLRWKAQPDSLEPTAFPDKYMIYSRVENGGFDNGVLVTADSLILTDLKPGVVYSFKVTALNAGGESFPSEILSVCRMENGKPTVLIVNGFDRVSAPAFVQFPQFSGFVNFEDEGVPDKYDFSFTGAQNDFNPASPFAMNDASGYGNSFADYETRLIAGNTFDFPFVHGQALRAAGYSFVSLSDESFADSAFIPERYGSVDLILGEERTMPWLNDALRRQKFKAYPLSLQKQLRRFTAAGGNLFVSGAYAGSDLFNEKDIKDPDLRFGREVLHISKGVNFAARTGQVVTRDTLFSDLSFNQRFNSHIYKVEAPDAIIPAGGAKTILRYAENEYSAATAFSGSYRCVVLGFPFETIIKEKQRFQLMRAILKFMDGI